MPEARQYDLGILFVHGIGTQRPNETLVHWGDALVDVIRRATAGHATLNVDWARSSEESGSTRSEMVLGISSAGREERWLVADAWWADSFPGPTYSELVSWSLRAVPWLVITHFAEKYWQVQSMPWGRAKIAAIVGALIPLPVALLMAPLFLVLLGVVLVLGAIPISQLQSFALTVQSMLTASVGDSLAFVESPVRAALIRTRILENLWRLRDRSDRIVVIAHSQGAAAVLEALGGFHDDTGASDVEPEAVFPKVDTLVTFGAGINQISSFRALASGLPTARQRARSNPTWIAVGSLSLFFFISAYLAQFTALDVALALATWIAGIGAVAVAGWLSVALIDRLARISAAVHSRRERYVVATLTIWLLIWIGGSQALTNQSSVPFGAVNLLMLSLLGILGSITAFLSKETRDSVTNVGRPQTVGRWVDLYAADDPVPNGPTRVIDDQVIESKKISNRGSIFFDHTTYWENLDGFVLRVAAICAEAAGSAWGGILPLANPDSDRRAAWRVRFLMWAARLHLFFWLFVFYLVWTQFGDRVPLPFDTPQWLPNVVSLGLRFVELVAVVGVAAWVAAGLLRLPWRIWVRREQRSVLANQIPTGWAWEPVVAMGMVLAAIGMGVDALGRGEASMIAAELLPTFGQWDKFIPNLLEVPAMMLGFGMFLAAFARLFWPAPSSSSPKRNAPVLE